MVLLSYLFLVSQWSSAPFVLITVKKKKKPGRMSLKISFLQKVSDTVRSFGKIF